MALSHPLTILAMVFAIIGLVSVGMKAAWLEIETQRAMQAIHAKPGAHRADGDLDVSCWVPADFSAAADRYAQNTCTTKFMHVIQGNVPAESAGINPVQEAPPPSGNDTGPAPSPFEAAMKVMADVPPQAGMAAPSEEASESPMERLLPMMYLQTALIIFGFAIAICFTRVAQSHSCVLNVSWRNCVAGDGTAGGSAAEGKGALLEKQSDVLGARVSSLMTTKTLALGYLAFTVIILLIWFFVGMGMYHGAGKIDSKIDEIAEMKQMMIQRMIQMKKMQAMAAAGQAPPQGGAQGGAGGPGGAPMGMPPMPGPTEASGDFLCDFAVQNVGTEQQYTVQCSYEVSREAPPAPAPPTDPTPLLKLWRQVMIENMFVCLVVAGIWFVHVVVMYVLGPLSRQRTMIPILQQLGAKPKAMGLRFGITDLSFVATFTNLGDNNGYLVTSAGGRATAVELNHFNDVGGEKAV